MLVDRVSLRRPRRVIAGSLILVALGACAKAPLVGGKPAIKLDVSATPDLNSCGKTGAPLYFRVLQVTDVSGMTGMSLAQLWGKEDKVFAKEMLGVPKEEVIDPGKSAEIKLDRDPKAKSLVVVGNFCKTQSTCWYLVKPLKGKGGVAVKLGFDATCVREVRR